MFNQPRKFKALPVGGSFKVNLEDGQEATQSEFVKVGSTSCRVVKDGYAHGATLGGIDPQATVYVR